MLPSPDTSPSATGPGASVVLGIGVVALLASLTYLAVAVRSSTNQEPLGSEPSDDVPSVAVLEDASAGFSLSVGGGDLPGPTVVVVEAGSEQVCSVVRGRAAEWWAGADVEWLLRGEVVADENSPTWAGAFASTSSCIAPTSGLRAGIYSVRWTRSDQELRDAVAVSNAPGTGFVEIANVSGADVCAVRFSSGDLMTTVDELAGALGSGRRTRFELPDGSHSYDVRACDGRLVGTGNVTVGAAIEVLAIGGDLPPSAGAEPEPARVDSEPEAPPSLLPEIGSGALASVPVWTSLVSDVGLPQDQLVFVGPENEGNFCLTWEYENVPAGSAFELVWSVDGVTGPGDVSSGTTSPPTAGNFWGCYGNPNGLPDGRYEAEWRIDGSAVFSESITVGSTSAAELRLVNASGVDVCGVYVFLPGSTSRGLDRLTQVLGPGASLSVSVAVGVVDVLIEACSGSQLLWSPGVTVAADGVEVPIGLAPLASVPVWTSLVSDVGLPQDQLVFVGPENEGNFCLTWEYENVPAGSAFELVWSVDGVTGPGDVSSGTTSPPTAGNFWGCYGNPNGLPDGRYEAEWRIDGSAVFSESITVGSATRSFLEVQNVSNESVCSVRVSVPGAFSPGLNQLTEVLQPGATVRIDVASVATNLMIEACTGRDVWVAGSVTAQPTGNSIVLN